MKPMRLAVVHNLPSGGALRAAGAQMRELARRHTLDLYTLSTAEHELVDRGARTSRSQVYGFEPSAPLARPFGMFDPLVRLSDLARLDRLYRRVAAQIDQGGYDAVLVHPCRFTQAPLVLRHLKRPAVYFCQEPPRALYEELPATPAAPPSWTARLRELRHRPLALALVRRLKALDREGCRRARVVAVNSHFMADQVRRIYAREPAVCYLGVDGGLFSPAPDVARGRHVLSVGALSPLKGFDLVIRALGQVSAERRPPLTLVSDRAGDGYHGELLACAREAGVTLTIELRVPDARLVHLYRTALVTLYAPVREPFGLVPLESMACGTPVVGVREGGVPESVEDGVTGLLCARDAAEFARAVDALLCDPARREALAAAGRARVLERWTWEASAARLESLLAGAASGAGPA